jgi:feruloyl-CoA synthase
MAVSAEQVRAARFWTPDIVVRHGEGGVIYVDQREPLPAYPDRITEPLLDWARRVPERTLYAERGPDGAWRRLSFRDAIDTTMRLGQFLLDAGLSADRPLAILSGNDLEHAMLALAAIHVGVPYATISPAYSLVGKDFSRLKQVFDTITPGMVFAADAKRFGPAIDAVAGDALRLFTRGAKMREQEFATALATHPTTAVQDAFDAIDPDRIAKFLFTSGSTGTPKAVANTHRMICSNQIMTRETFAFFKDEPPVLLDWAPWHHTAGGNKLFFIPVFNGGTLYIDDGSPSPEGAQKTARNIRDVSPNWYFNVPKGFDALIPLMEADPELPQALFKRLKMLWYAGAGMAQHTWDALEGLAVRTIGARIIIGTGLGATETAPVALSCTWVQDKAGNIGLPVLGVSLKLVPMEGKLDARVKGPNITPGYWRAPELTAAAFDEEGYYRFGDALRFADPGDISAGFIFDGRTAENFKLDTGTWVSSGALRTAMIDHFGGIVRDAAIAGADKPFVSAIVFPDMDSLKKLAGGDLPTETLFAHPTVVEAFRAKLRGFAAESTGSSTLVKAVLLADPPPSPEDGELTDKGSVNQRAALRNRAGLVYEIYAGSPRVISL